MNTITTLSFWRRPLLAALLLLQVPLASYAADGEPVVYIGKLDGSLGQIHVDSVVQVSDMALSAITFSSQNKVSLSIDESVRFMPEGPFTASVGLHIAATFKDSTGNYDTTLTISYSDTGAYVHEHAFYFKDAYDVEVTVTSVSTDAAWDVWKLLKVYNEMSALPSLEFSCTLQQVDSVSWDHLSPGTESDHLFVSWAEVPAADEFDLEWAYIDSSALASGQYGSPASPSADLLFDNNASRVTSLLLLSARSFRLAGSLI